MPSGGEPLLFTATVGLPSYSPLVDPFVVEMFLVSNLSDDKTINHLPTLSSDGEEEPAEEAANDRLLQMDSLFAERRSSFSQNWRTW